MNHHIRNRISALWVSVDEYIKAGATIPPGFILYHVEVMQALGCYHGHNDLNVIISNVNCSGQIFDVPREDLMINTLWLPSLN